MPARKVDVHFTERAILDLHALEAYSLAHFGQRATEQYLQDLQAAVDRLGLNPGLLIQDRTISGSFRPYRVRKHLLICERHSGVIFILTILHGAMEVPARLLELEPTLLAESRLLTAQLARQSKRKSDA